MIETTRLILRKPQLGDEIQLNQAINASLTELQRWMPWALDASIEPTTQFIKAGIESWSNKEQKDFPMIIVDKQSQQIIGASGYNDRSNPTIPYFEIGYWIDNKFTGIGIATEMVLALKDYAFKNLKASRVQIVTQKENIKSIRVAEKCGFQLEGTLRNFCIDCITNKPADDLMFSCIK